MIAPVSKIKNLFKQHVKSQYMSGYSCHSQVKGSWILYWWVFHSRWTSDSHTSTEHNAIMQYDVVKTNQYF